MTYSLKSRTARIALPTLDDKGRPVAMYLGPPLKRPGTALLYRRNAGRAGSWVVRFATGKGRYKHKTFATADDIEDSDGKRVLNFHEALEQAPDHVPDGSDDTTLGEPITVEAALTAYAGDLVRRGRSAKNLDRVRHWLPDGTDEARPRHSLLGKYVGMLADKDLTDWLDEMLNAGRARATVNRNANVMRRVLNNVANRDPRITNRAVWAGSEGALKRLRGANRARRMVLTTAEVLRFLAEIQAEGEHVALAFEGLAHTGTRMSQLARVNCGDLGKVSVEVPSAFKGHDNKEATPASVPLDLAFVAKLAAARGDRPDDAPLFLNPQGERWGRGNEYALKTAFARAAERAGLDSRKITPYALRHSSICRAILDHVPLTIVAQRHDTSVEEIQKHYSKWINDIAGDIGRRGLLHVAPDNVVPMARAA
jgi:integrase